MATARPLEFSVSSGDFAEPCSATSSSDVNIMVSQNQLPTGQSVMHAGSSPKKTQLMKTFRGSQVMATLRGGSGLQPWRHGETAKCSYILRASIVFFCLMFTFLLTSNSLADVVNTMEASWNDWPRSDKRPFVCQMTRGTDDKQLQCGTHWLLFANACYKYAGHAVKKNWSDANIYCNELAKNASFEGDDYVLGSLVTISSPTINAITHMLCEEGAEPCWVGLHQPQGGNRMDNWVWSNGGKPIYTNWWSQRPDNGRGLREEDACGMFVSEDDQNWNFTLGKIKMGMLISACIIFVCCSCTGACTIYGVYYGHKICMGCGAISDLVLGILLLLLSALCLGWSFGSTHARDHIRYILGLILCTLFILAALMGAFIVARIEAGEFDDESFRDSLSPSAVVAAFTDDSLVVTFSDQLSEERNDRKMDPVK